MVSIFLICAFGLLAFGMDNLDRKLHEQNVRLDVSVRLEVLRSRIERQINTNISAAQNLALEIAGKDQFTQDAFSELADDVFDNFSGLINIAWAPDLIITHVYPYAQNQSVVGLDYRSLPNQIDDVLRVRDSGKMTVVGPVDLVQGPRGFILRLPVFVPSEAGPKFRGILSMVFNFETFLNENLNAGQPLGLDVALSTRNSIAATAAQEVLGNAMVLVDTPVEATLLLPQQIWTLHARPMGGWQAASRYSITARLLVALLLVLVTVVSLSALWLAHSRRGTLQQVQTKDQILKAVIRNAPGVFLSCHVHENGALKVDYISDACQTIWEMPPESFYSDPDIFEKLMDKAQFSAWRAAIYQAQGDGTDWHITWKSITPSGQEKWLETWAHPTEVKGGRTRWDGFSIDITAAREKEIRFDRQMAIAHQAQKQESIGQLTGGVAHDFNNLLAVIMGNLELLRDDISDPEHLGLIETSLNATQRGAGLTSNMLAFARKARLEPRMIDLNQLVSETRNWIGRTLPARISLDTSLAPDLWAIEADPSSTESALLNLIVNGRDAMPEGGNLTIETGNVVITQSDFQIAGQALNPGRYVMLAVTDTGTGIAPENLSHIFEPFYSTKPPGAGSGLGLSMIQGFMEQSGGTVRVYSECGIGTTFKLYFQAIVDPPLPESGPVAEPDTAPDKKLHILMAEDETAVRETLVRILKRAGYVVTAAKTGDEAKARFIENPGFDLLLTDIVMPGTLQGPALSKALRDLAPDLPVVFMSGYAKEATVHGNGLRPEDIRLMKPVLRADLLAAIRKALNFRPGNSD